MEDREATNEEHQIPANKRADDDAIREFVADHETAVIAPEVAERFDIGKTTAREALGRLCEAGRLTTRKPSPNVRLYYVPRSDASRNGANTVEVEDRDGQAGNRDRERDDNASASDDELEIAELHTRLDAIEKSFNLTRCTLSAQVANAGDGMTFLRVSDELLEEFEHGQTVVVEIND